MTHERKNYIKSNEYRHTLKVGDEVIRIMADGKNLRGRITEVGDQYIHMTWDGGAKNGMCANDYPLNERSFVVLRFCDLTEEEATSIVTQRLVKS